jgi:NADH dehydrogenase
MLDRSGRVPVDSKLHPEGLPDVFVIGDLAALVQDGQPVPGVAPAAIQEGRWAARAIVDELQGRYSRPFRYQDKGEVATIGRSKAVALFPRGVEVSGLLAWLIYSTVHLVYLTGFGNRLMVFLTWAWSFLTYRRGARLIPGGAEEEADANRPDTAPAGPDRKARVPENA